MMSLARARGSPELVMGRPGHNARALVKLTVLLAPKQGLTSLPCRVHAVGGHCRNKCKVLTGRNLLGCRMLDVHLVWGHDPYGPLHLPPELRSRGALVFR